MMIFIPLMSLAFTSHAASDNALEKCLSLKPKEIQLCLNQTASANNIESCFNQAKKIKSQYLKENLHAFCFYQISEFTSLNSCLNKALQFIDVQNHDAAIFNCYSQFEQNIGPKKCLQISQLIRAPEKARYLKNQCENLK